MIYVVTPYNKSTFSDRMRAYIFELMSFYLRIQLWEWPPEQKPIAGNGQPELESGGIFELYQVIYIHLKRDQSWKCGAVGVGKVRQIRRTTDICLCIPKKKETTIFIRETSLSLFRI